MANEEKKYEFRVQQPIVPDAKEGEMHDELTEGDSIHLTEEEAQPLLEAEVVAYPDELKARKERSAEEKEARAEQLEKEAKQLRKEAKQEAPKSSARSSKDEKA